MMVVPMFLPQMTCEDRSLTYPEKVEDATCPGRRSAQRNQDNPLGSHSAATQSSGSPSLWREGTPVVPASYPWFVGHIAPLNLPK